MLFRSNSVATVPVGVSTDSVVGAGSISGAAPRSGSQSEGSISILVSLKSFIIKKLLVINEISI